jgi:hypothetical protein
VALLRGFEPHSHPQTESSGVVWGGTLPTCAGSSRWVPRGACDGADREVLARAGDGADHEVPARSVGVERRHPRQSRPGAVTYPVCLRLWCLSVARPQLAYGAAGRVEVMGRETVPEEEVLGPCHHKARGP